MTQGNMNRRSFLKWTGMTSAGIVLAACSAPAAPAPGGAAEGEAAAPSGEATPVLFWFQAENHEPEYSGRIEELNEKFDIDFSFEILARDTMNAEVPSHADGRFRFPGHP